MKMKSKNLICLFLIYFIPFIFSSCCNCEDQNYQIIYTGLELTTWDTRGFENTKILDSIPKDTFGLSILLSNETSKVTDIKTKLKTNFGFTAAYAVVDCFCDPGIIIKDPINSIIIKVKNSETNEIIDVTTNFSSYGDKTIEELLDNFEDNFEDNFNLDLIKFDNIPNSSIFKVIVTLDSGIEFIKETEIILFK